MSVLAICYQNVAYLFIYLFFNLFFIAGVAARETAQALRTLAQAARGVAASTKEPQAAAAMLDSAQYVMEGSAMLIHEAHQALVHPGDAESQQRLAQVAHVPAVYSQMQYQCPTVITLFFSLLFPHTAADL